MSGDHEWTKIRRSEVDQDWRRTRMRISGDEDESPHLRDLLLTSFFLQVGHSLFPDLRAVMMHSAQNLGWGGSSEQGHDRGDRGDLMD